VEAGRRIKALIAMGWPHRIMTERLGFQTALVLSQQGRWITRRKHDAIAAMFEELCMTPGPSNQSRGWAAKYGYLPPLTWDDIDNDDEPLGDEVEEDSGEVDEVAVQRRIAGDKSVNITKQEQRLVVEQMIEAGIGHGDIEERTGLNPTRVRSLAVSGRGGVSSVVPPDAAPTALVLSAGEGEDLLPVVRAG
jgi:hypothetical protein